MKVLVIGGVAAGTKAAAKIKRQAPGAEVKILTKSNDISYAGCGLPYYVGGIIAQESELIVNTPEKYRGLTGADVVTGCEVTCVDFAAKTVSAVKNGAEVTESYDKLVIATGAAPFVPNIPGTDLEGVFVMRTPDDAIGLRSYVKENNCRTAIVAGAGFIGLEIAENLRAQGLQVTVIDMASHIMPGAFDAEMANFAASKLRAIGIRIQTGAAISAITGEGKADGIMTSGIKMNADVVVLALGIRPSTSFLADSGIAMEKGAIIVDENMRTNVADVYAAGDCALVHNRITGKAQQSAMGSTANISARALARHATGSDVSYAGCLGTGVVKLVDGFNAGRTGLTEAQAKAEGYDVVTAVSVLDDKPHYYTGAASFIIKLIADRASHKLLGVQVFGAGAVDKIVDIAAVGLSANMTLEDFDTIDFAYAPPFSTAIHPFTQACYVLENKINGALDTFTPAEYAAGAAEGYTVIDIQEVATIPGATWVDLNKIVDSVPGFDKDAKLLFVCARGKRGYLAQNRLRHYGYTNTKVLEGGISVNTVKVKFTGTIPAAEVSRVKGLGCLQDKRYPDRFNVRVITRNGKITGAEQHAIAEAAELFGSGEVTMTTRLTLEIQGVPYANIDKLIEFLAQHGLETGGTGSKVRPVVSCKGTTCQYGLCDTFGLSQKLHDRFYTDYHNVALPHKFKIAVGGCPNNCVKPDLNDLGVIGQRIPRPDITKCRGCKVCQVEQACPIKIIKVVDGKIVLNPDECNHCGRCIGKCPFKVIEEGTYGYKVYIGGRWGKKVAAGIPLSRIFTSEEEVMDIVERAILFFRDEGISGERFADTITRLGFEYTEDKLLNGAIDKDAIMQKNVIGGATC